MYITSKMSAEDSFIVNEARNTVNISESDSTKT